MDRFNASMNETNVERTSLQTGHSVTSNSVTVAKPLKYANHSSVPCTANEDIDSKDEPISLDLSVYDEYGNRTVPIYRRSVKLKFDSKEKIREFLQNRQLPVSELPFNYHATTSMADLKSVPATWKCNMLDDDVITAVMNCLQTASLDTLFVNPCLTQCILFAKVKHVALFLDPLVAKKYANVFFVLNDSCRMGGSSHWSMMAYNKQAGRLFHFDSMHNTNYRVAYELAQKLCEYLNVWAITDVYCEQQTNSTDCGYYVIDNIMKLLYILRQATHTPLSQVSRLPSLIEKTKNFVVNVYLRAKAAKIK